MIVAPGEVLNTVPLAEIDEAEPNDATVAPNIALLVVIEETVGKETVGGADTVKLKLSIPIA